MKVLELFAGTRSIGKAFEAKGHEVFSVEWDKKFENIDLYKDIGELTASEILDKFGQPDVVWMSPDCSSYSMAAIFYHRVKNPETGNLDPKTDYAKFCDRVDQHCLDLIDELKPKFWFIENPRGGLRSMTFMQGLPRYTVSYCFAGDERFITNDGHKSFKETVNQDVTVLNINGEWEHGIVRNYGVDELYKITLSRAGRQKTIYTTKNHIWLAALPTGTKYNYKKLSTLELKSKMLLPYAIPHKIECDIIPEYVCRGFVFGDGYVLKNKPSVGSFAQFVGEKVEMLKYFDGFGGKRWHSNKGDLEIIRCCTLPYDWKSWMPTTQNTPSEIYSWLAGYIAADGSCSKTTGQVSLSSSKREDLEKVRELAEHIGIGTYPLDVTYRKGYNDYETPLYQITFMRECLDDQFLLRSKHKSAYLAHKDIKFQPRRWSVVSVEPTGIITDVYCVETDFTHTFTLLDNIVTHNCQYGDIRQKPTDIWTNHADPKFKPLCKPGAPCHVAAPRGSRTGTQGLANSMERSRIPEKLCEHIVNICEEYIDSQTTDHTPGYYKSKVVQYRSKKLF